MLSPEIPEGFKPHDGGPCPVGMHTVVTVRYSCGHLEAAKGEIFAWWHENDPWDIIAYREEPSDAA
jgi:hypothetical protein